MPTRLVRLSFALILVCFAAVWTAAQEKVDVSGQWALAVQTDAGPGEASATFKQDGEKLTGRYVGTTLGEADLTGTVKGREIEFSFTVSPGGMSVPVSYKGTVEGNSSIKGSLSITGLGNGTFTATRK